MPIRKDLIQRRGRLPVRSLKGLRWLVLDGACDEITISGAAGCIRLGKTAAKRFIGLLIDSGCEVHGYWRKKSYRYLDPRIVPGGRE